MSDQDYIQKCFELAKKAIGLTSPNPYVGAVIVKDNKVLATGYHHKAGEDHAEIDAIKKVDPKLIKGSTLYCNLEPCCHTNKKTPPCAQKIIELGFAKVVIANLDPNPAVAGSGVRLLEEAGIEVITGIEQESGALLNEVFFTNMQKKRPFIHLKWAQTLDGKIATLSKQSKWITNENSRKHVHLERNLYDAIVVGDQTIINDDPSLTTRINDVIIAKKRIILNPSIQLDHHYKIFRDDFREKTILVRKLMDESKKEVQQIIISTDLEGFDLNKVLENLYAQGICSIYVEGGMHTISTFIDQNLFDRVSIYTAPKLLGPGVSLNTKQKESMHEAFEFEAGIYTQFGNNILFESQRNICLQD